MAASVTFKEEDAEAPPVARLVDALVEEHLGRGVVGRAAARVSAVAHALCQPKVAQLDVTVATGSGRGRGVGSEAEGCVSCV